MALRMVVLNLTPDSFYAPSRYDLSVLDGDADIVDIGAVSTRPGAEDVPLEEEWSRLEPVLAMISGRPSHKRISLDTTRSVIVKRAVALIPDIIVNDISAGEDDLLMLETVGAFGLQYVAMHRRGTPKTMDKLCDYREFATDEYPSGVIPALIDYFKKFALRAESAGVSDWILDPGLGFAKTTEQSWEILHEIPALKTLGRPVLIGAADKRFTGGDNARAEELAIRFGADILRVHSH